MNFLFMKFSIKLVTVVSITVLLFGCGSGKKDLKTQEIYTVGKVSLRDAISQTGEVEPIVKVDIKSEASGQIDTILVKEGQRVAKGDTILIIDPYRLKLSKEEIDLSIRKANIQKKIAKRNLENAKALSETGTISSIRIEDLKNEYDLASIASAQQYLRLKDVRDQLRKTVVKSPMDGVITSLDVEEGEIAVSATSGYSGGTAIATVADISRLKVVSQIGEVDYIHLKEGQKVVITPEALEGVVTYGTIDFIALSAKKQSAEALGTFEVSISIDSLVPAIAPGINVNVEFLILEQSGVLGVPNYFITKGAKGAFVKRVTSKVDESKKMTTEDVKVKLGVTDYKNYEILEGLSEGDVLLYTDNSKPKPHKKSRKHGK